MAAEQNFNPFVVSIPSICSDATLPATAELRGVVPLIDPAVTGSDTENANSKTSLTTPFDATGLSVAQIMAAQGFSNLTAVAADGTKAAAGGAATGGAATGAASGANGNVASGAAAGNGTASASNGNANAGSGGKKSSCSSGKKGKGSNNNNAGANAGANTGSAATGAAAAGSASSNSTASAGTAATGGKTSLAGADFGKCTPTMDFQFGRAGRKATEGTFLPTDPLVAKGQQDALNPNIITNRICDQLTNVCEANQAAKDACQSAKATIQSLGTKDATTATAFNQALGF